MFNKMLILCNIFLKLYLNGQRMERQLAVLHCEFCDIRIRMLDAFNFEEQKQHNRKCSTVYPR